MSNAIEFENISKQYRLGLVSTHTLAHDIRRFWITNVLGKEDPYLKIGETNDRSTKGSSEYVWALRDINFKVEQGDVVGIIGKNGAGKSTLLKLLSKVTGPTTGTIRAKGRIGSLLEVGTGFHSEMTGRENIFLNGAILGMSKQEIARKLDEIVDFSGCERYIDTPVKRYSSGMMVRLGFAVAAHLDPEILVVDEVLAVGDAEFQKKAIGKMQDVSKGEGRTVLFVSHNMASIRALCNHGVLLSKGSVEFIGGVNECVDLYLRDCKGNMQKQICDRKDRFGTQEARIIDLYFTETDTEKPLEMVVSGMNVDIHLVYESKIDYEYAIASLDICDMKENCISYVNSKITGNSIPIHKGHGEIVCSIKKLPLNFGEYAISCSLMDAVGSYFDDVTNAKIIKVVEGRFYETGLMPVSCFPSLIDARFVYV